MIHYFKRWFYFPGAWYFRFWAGWRLRRWHPRIIVITGSSGKTTLLHLVESQLGDTACYSHQANSSYGIPFDILGLHRPTLLAWEWPLLFLLAPLKALFPPPPQKIYLVEADCDRPHEGKFLSQFLQPEVTLWISLSKTHSMNFDHLVANQQFASVEAAIAFEFGWFITHTQKLVIASGDSPLIASQLSKATTRVKTITQQQWLDNYRVSLQGTQFVVRGQTYSFPYILPQETIYALAMCLELMDYLNLPLDPSFARFTLPPGRSSVFPGIKHTTLIDSTYNANLDSITAILNLYRALPAQHKWLVLGDMLEQGEQEKSEHEQLAHLIAALKLDRIILLGPRLAGYTYPSLQKLIGKPTILASFLQPKQVLDYIKAHLQGGEILLFKGARFLEGVIEHLLVDSSQARLLPRREKIWAIRRTQWGL